MDTEIKVALISVAGVLVSAFVSWLVANSATKFNYKQLFAQTVSNNRMDWINVWRENISKFLACAEIIYTQLFDKLELQQQLDLKKEMFESRAMITSRLNMNEEKHEMMCIAINKLDTNNFVAQREIILQLEREILKEEWERVKQEAKGEKYGK